MEEVEIVKKRLKVFNSVQTLTKGDFSIDRVKQIVENTNARLETVQATNHHSSKWEKAWGNTKKHLEFGSVDNFSANENGEVFADIELNSKGEMYYEDGSIKNISVEIDRDKNEIIKVACLPPWDPQHIKDAVLEFNDDNPFGANEGWVSIIEFEEGGVKMPLINGDLGSATLDEKVEALKAIGGTFTKGDVAAANTIRDLFYQMRAEFSDEDLGQLARDLGIKPVESEEEIRARVKAEFEAEKNKRANESPEEIEKRVREEMKAEFEAERAKDQRVSEFMEDHKRHIYPAFKNEVKGLVKEIASSSAVIEFSAEEKGDPLKALSNVLKKIAKLPEVGVSEFEAENNLGIEGKTVEEIVREAEELMKSM